MIRLAVKATGSRGYKNKDLDLVFETVAGETRTDFDLTNNILTYTGSCNDKEEEQTLI